MATSDLKPKSPEYERWVDPATGEFRVIEPGQTFRSVTDKITRIVLTPHTPLGWFALFGIAGAGATVLLVAVTWLFLVGVGIWAITQPVAWGFAIINFVWWIGIGHAGTLISAILLLFKQGWRNSINRFAEAMTIFAVVCAGTFPLIHVGRPWLGYWLLPYPNTMTVWPQFRSPLLWDVFAVSTYATISVVFWYIGMVPDFGTMRDRSKHRLPQYFYGLISLGWRGSVRHWMRYETDRYCSRAWQRRWCSQYTPSSASTSQWLYCRDGTPPSSRPTSLPAPSTPDSPWCSRSPFHCASSTTLKRW